MIRWFKCRDASVMLSREQDHPLSASERASLRLHLMVCGACRNFKNNLLIISAAMKQYLDKGADRNKDGN